MSTQKILEILHELLSILSAIYQHLILNFRVMILNLENVSESIIHFLAYLTNFREGDSGCHRRKLLESFMHSGVFLSLIYHRLFWYFRDLGCYPRKFVRIPPAFFLVFILFDTIFRNRVLLCQPCNFYIIVHIFWFRLSSIYHSLFRKGDRSVTLFVYNPSCISKNSVIHLHFLKDNFRMEAREPREPSTCYALADISLL